MTKWTSDELDKIGTAEELDIFTYRQDGTPRKGVTIWVVRVGDGLYVRSYKGQDGAWFRAIQANPEGSIRAGGVEKDVAFVGERDPGINDEIDEEYRVKYGRFPAEYVDPMVTSEVRATTIKLVPR
ncbi:MAG: DUF2255 family protein [Candidatus Promineifilaceae bacterium]